MKMVIDIPEEMFEKANNYSLQMIDLPTLSLAITGGTPLPDTVDHYNAVVYMQGVADGLNAKTEMEGEKDDTN